MKETKIKDLIKRYHYHITFDEKECEYIATVTEFPYISWFSDTMNGALDGIVEIVEDTLYDIKENNGVFPEPKGVENE